MTIARILLATFWVAIACVVLKLAGFSASEFLSGFVGTWTRLGMLENPSRTVSFFIGFYLAAVSMGAAVATFLVINIWLWSKLGKRPDREW